MDKKVPQNEWAAFIDSALKFPDKYLDLSKLKVRNTKKVLQNRLVEFIGLDVVAQKKIRDFIKKYNEERKTTIILTSHYMEDISQLCKRIVIIDLGKIVFDGQLEDLVSKYATNKKVTIFFDQEITRQDAEKLGKICQFESNKVSFDVPRLNVKDAVAKILSSEFSISDIEIDEEDVESIIRNVFTK